MGLGLLANCYRMVKMATVGWQEEKEPDPAVN